MLALLLLLAVVGALPAAGSAATSSPQPIGQRRWAEGVPLDPSLKLDVETSPEARSGARQSPRHIVLVLVDELGTGDVPWSDPEMYAPTIKVIFFVYK